MSEKRPARPDFDVSLARARFQVYELELEQWGASKPADVDEAATQVSADVADLLGGGPRPPETPQNYKDRKEAYVAAYVDLLERRLPPHSASGIGGFQREFLKAIIDSTKRNYQAAEALSPEEEELLHSLKALTQFYHLPFRHLYDLSTELVLRQGLYTAEYLICIGSFAGPSITPGLRDTNAEFSPKMIASLSKHEIAELEPELINLTPFVQSWEQYLSTLQLFVNVCEHEIAAHRRLMDEGLESFYQFENLRAGDSYTQLQALRVSGVVDFHSGMDETLRDQKITEALQRHLDYAKNLRFEDSLNSWEATKRYFEIILSRAQDMDASHGEDTAAWFESALNKPAPFHTRMNYERKVWHSLGSLKDRSAEYSDLLNDFPLVDEIHGFTEREGLGLSRKAVLNRLFKDIMHEFTSGQDNLYEQEGDFLRALVLKVWIAERNWRALSDRDRLEWLKGGEMRDRSSADSRYTDSFAISWSPTITPS